MSGLNPKERWLKRQKLGGDWLKKKLLSKNLAELQENAIKHLCTNIEGSELVRSLGFVYTPFMEMLVAYGMASRAQTDRIKEQTRQLDIANEEFQNILEQVNDLYSNVNHLKDKTASITSHTAQKTRA